MCMPVTTYYVIPKHNEAPMPQVYHVSFKHPLQTLQELDAGLNEYPSLCNFATRPTLLLLEIIDGAPIPISLSRNYLKKVY